MSNNTYNGWSNLETWLVNLHLEGLLDVRANENDPMSAEELGDLVRDSMYGEDGPSCPMLFDLMRCAFDRVNWDEIANHYHDEAAA